MPVGRVKFFNENKGYGFIAIDGSDGEEIFVHASQVEEAGLGPLIKGQKIAFDTAHAKKGPKAINLRDPE